MNIYRKYIGKLNWLASYTRPDLSVYVMNFVRQQKKATLKNLRKINRIIKKVTKKENSVVFSKVAEKGKLGLIGVSGASYSQEDRSVAGEIIMLGNRENKKVAPIDWKSGMIRKVCTSSKAPETRGVIKLVDDVVNTSNQLKILKVFTHSRPLLATIGSSSQVAEKALRQLVAYLKQSLEDREVE